MRVNTRTDSQRCAPVPTQRQVRSSQGVNQNPHALPPIGALERPLSTNPGFRGVSGNAPVRVDRSLAQKIATVCSGSAAPVRSFRMQPFTRDLVSVGG